MKKIIILFFLFIIFKISLAQTGTVTITPTYSVCLGTVVTMTASGFVAPTITRWETSPNNNPPWTAIASSNSPTITVTASASLYYRAVATTGLAATNSALLTINQPSAGTVSSNATVCSGINSGTLTLSGTFTSVNFWEYSIDGGNTWTPISNTTTSQNYLNLTTYTQYRVDMTNGICPSAKATPAIITVNPTSIGGTAAGTATVCSGSNGGTLLLSGYSGSVIKWQSSTDGDITWTNITNITNTNNYSNITQTTDYRAVVQSGTCASANSSSATISVSPVSDGGTISGAASVCSGANNGTLTLSGQTGTILNWSSSIDGGNTWTPIANTTSSQNYSNLIATTMYLATVQNGSCASANSTSATITVSPGSIGGIVLGATSTCAGSNNGTLTLSGYTGNIVRWQSSVDGGITWANITNTSAYNNYSNLAQTTDFRAVVQNGICAAANSSIARITIVPISDGGTVNSNATVCSGANNGTLQLINYTGTVAQWEKSTDNGFNWNIISNGTDTLSYSNLTIKTLFRALVQSGTCTANYSTPATITINSLSVGGIISGADTICSGSNSGNLILSGYFGSIVRWQSSTDGGVSWNNISNTTAIYNYVNIVTTTNYRAVIQNGGCPAANSADAIITVFPVSAGGNLSPAAFSACNGINNGTIILSGHSGNINLTDANG